MSFLELQHVSKSYGRGNNRTEVLHDINLSIREGEFVAIVGYSGTGKTTLMSTIAGLLRPDSGQVLFNGKPVTAPGPERALVFQNYSLLPWLSVFDNIAPGRRSGLPHLVPPHQTRPCRKIRLHGQPRPRPRQKTQRTLRRNAPTRLRRPRPRHETSGPSP